MYFILLTSFHIIVYFFSYKTHGIAYFFSFIQVINYNLTNFCKFDFYVAFDSTHQKSHLKVRNPGNWLLPFSFTHITSKEHY